MLGIGMKPDPKAPPRVVSDNFRGVFFEGVCRLSVLPPWFWVPTVTDPARLFSHPSSPYLPRLPANTFVFIVPAPFVFLFFRILV